MSKIAREKKHSTRYLQEKPVVAIDPDIPWNFLLCLCLLDPNPKYAQIPPRVLQKR